MDAIPARKNYYGLAAFITGMLSVLFISANIGASYLRITPAVFSTLNIITALFYCILTPSAFTLGVLGLFHRNDSKILAGMGIVMVSVPFVVILGQLLRSLMSS